MYLWAMSIPTYRGEYDPAKVSTNRKDNLAFAHNFKITYIFIYIFC